jgi:molybdopterin converting factor small subunit
MQVRLFAVLREIAGSGTVEAEGSTVEQLVQQLCDRYGERFTAIVERSSIVIDGERVSLDASAAGVSEIAILPPVSGGGS